MKEYIFSDLQKICTCKERISNRPRVDCWQYMDYQTASVSGRLLLAGEECKPQEVEMSIGLHGWYKIYIAYVDMFYPSDEKTRILIKLSDEVIYHDIRSSRYVKPRHWMPYEYVEENFWKCAYLTGQSILLKKPDIWHPFVTAIAWIRCVEMTAEEVRQYEKDIANTSCRHCHVHYDNDDCAEGEVSTIQDTLTRLACLQNSDAKFCSIELSCLYDLVDLQGRVSLTTEDKAMLSGTTKMLQRIQEINKAKIELLHSYGIRAYAAYRMSLGNFQVPYNCLAQLRFVQDHPQFFCRTREGDVVKVCSYAYRDVQDYMIEMLKGFVSEGFDGVSLIYHRGIHLGFEQPVLDTFAEKYPGIDPCRLPFSDERLNGVWRELMTGFMKRLREELDHVSGRHVYINVIMDFSPKTSYDMGLDAAEWACLGLVDSICQGDMETFENLEGCLLDDGTIDMEKYKKKIKRERVVERFHSNDLEKTKQGAKQYQKITDEYGVEFYGGMPYPNVQPECYLKYKEALKELGVTGYSIFNFIHSTWDLPSCHVLTKLCHDRIPEEERIPAFYRVISLDGSNIGTYNPNWRG